MYSRAPAKYISVLWAIIALALLLRAAPAGADIYLTVDEALELAWPGCQVERSTVFLTEAQMKRVLELSQVEVPSAIIHPYRVQCEGKPAGMAFFDAHDVRAKGEVLMIAVNSDATVRRVEVLSFDDHPDYLPRKEWYGQFDGQPLHDGLTLDRSIILTTGATLTSRSTVNAVRRSLAFFEVLEEGTK
jgi:Na+-translocating ferredoxin:NAD+ oxidoreductase RnfG subunit